MALSLTSHVITTDQNLVNNIGVANRQMVNVGGVLYLITKRFVPFLSADGLLVVYKSDGTGLIWSLAASIGTGPNSPGGSSTEFSLAVVGTTIYILDYKPGNAGPGSGNFHLGIWTYDTVANTLTGPGASGPFANDTAAPGLTALNSGSLLASYTVTNDAFGNVAGYKAVTYNPATDTWGAAITLNATASSQTLAQIHDATTDKTVVFYNVGGTLDMVASVLDATPSVLTTTAAIYSFPVSFKFIGTWGAPTVTSDSASGGSSVAFPFFNASSVLQMAFVDLATFAVAVETVDDGTDLPAGLIIQQYGQQDQPGWSALDFGGTLYTIFTVDNGNLDNASSLSFLYAKARTGGVWTGLQNLYSSPVSNEMMMPFATSWNSNGPAITMNLWNPTANIQTDPVSNMTSILLLPSGSAGGNTKFEISLLGVKRWGKSPEVPCQELPPPVHVKVVM